MVLVPVLRIRQAPLILSESLFIHGNILNT